MSGFPMLAITYYTLPVEVGRETFTLIIDTGQNSSFTLRCDSLIDWTYRKL